MNNQQNEYGDPVPIGGPVVRVMRPDGTSEVISHVELAERERVARLAAAANLPPGIREFHIREQVRRMQDSATPWNLHR